METRTFNPSYMQKRSVQTCSVCTTCVGGCIALVNPTGLAALLTATFLQAG
jgi:succinate dehydrogenase/fumarate reductase-like Fe-S protein